MGGLNQDICREIGYHFLQEPPRDLKIPDFFKNDVRLRVKEFFEHILNDCLENEPSFDKNLQIF